MSIFPNANVVGNFYKLDYLGCFDVFLVGIGNNVDEKGRFYIYKKNKENRFPNKEEVSDRLVALSMLYGSSTNISTTQTQYKRSYPELSRKPSVLFHENPAQLSKEGEKIKNYKPDVPVNNIIKFLYRW